MFSFTHAYGFKKRSGHGEHLMKKYRMHSLFSLKLWTNFVSKPIFGTSNRSHQKQSKYGIEAPSQAHFDPQVNS